MPAQGGRGLLALVHGASTGSSFVTAKRELSEYSYGCTRGLQGGGSPIVAGSGPQKWGPRRAHFLIGHRDCAKLRQRLIGTRVGTLSGRSKGLASTSD